MQIFTLIPLGTQISILVLFILAIATLFLRCSLYEELIKINSRVSRLLISGEEEGSQPKIVNRLRERYQKANQKLENVNTLSLIDSIYKNEQLSFLNFKIQFDRAEGMTRALPNLLIAFGLIGTFWGITSNLSNISNIVADVSQSNSDVNGLVKALKLPLQDMGIAFATSLFGLVFGSALTIANTILNTSIVRYQLFSSLEDYLDNIYKPTVVGHTRLDVAIDRMVRQQEEFLTRFHENVGAVLEKTFGQAANQIAEECGRINTIAEYVYSNFSNAAGTISTGADTFQQSAILLGEQVQAVTDLMPQLEDGVATFASAANKVETNKIITRLNILVENLSATQSEFNNSTQVLSANVESLTSSHLQYTQSAEKVYQGLEEATTCMQSGASDFVSAAQIIRDVSLAGDLTNAAKKLQNVQDKFDQSTIIFGQAVTDFQPIVSELNPTIVSLDRAVNALSRNLDLNQDKFDQSTTTFSQAVTDLQPIASKLEPAIISLDQAVSSLQQVGSEIVNLVQVQQHNQS